MRATRISSSHDFGRDLIPSIIHSHRVFAFPFRDENQQGGDTQSYWRDVGTIDAYYEANMDLISVNPQLNMYDDRWPVRRFQTNLPPPKFVFDEPGPGARRGEAHDSIVCAGSVISGGSVARTILGARTRINSFCRVEDSILFEGVQVGRHTKIRRAIIDKGVEIPPESRIGFDHVRDRQRGFTISPGGVTVIAKGDVVGDA